MAFDLKNIQNINFGGGILKIFVTPLFWLFFLLILVISLFGMLYIRKRRTLRYPVIEVTAFGLNKLKAGWFGLNLYLGGLLWRGRKVMRTDDMEIINNFEESDFIEINGQRGILMYRDPKTQLLYPMHVSQFEPIGFEGIRTKVPPREFRDTAVEIIKETTSETSDRLQKILQFAGWALVVIGSLIAIIVITQMVKNGQAEASKLIVDAGTTCLNNAKDICSQILSSRISGTAP